MGSQVQPNQQAERTEVPRTGGYRECEGRKQPARPRLGDGRAVCSEHGKEPWHEGLRGACSLAHEGMKAEPEGVAGTGNAPVSASRFLLGHSEPAVARLPGSWTRPVTKFWPLKRARQ